MDSVKQNVRTILARSLGNRRIDQVTDRDDIFALGFVNSLFAMQLVMFIEKEFGITVEDEDLDIQNFNTVEAIANLVERKRAGAAEVAVGLRWNECAVN
jgi:acyl carrier protein